MILRRIRWRLRTRKCACGQIRIIPGTRTEVIGVSHGDTPCYHILMRKYPKLYEADPPSTWANGEFHIP